MPADYMQSLFAGGVAQFCSRDMHMRQLFISQKPLCKQGGVTALERGLRRLSRLLGKILAPRDRLWFKKKILHHLLERLFTCLKMHYQTIFPQGIEGLLWQEDYASCGIEHKIFALRLHGSLFCICILKLE